MASHTPNLDLLKKDPVTDGSETFNIETMLNDNWDKIDAAMGQVQEELADIDLPLSDATNGTRSDVAASEKAVGQVMSAAQAAQTAASAANTAAAAAQNTANSASSAAAAANNSLGPLSSLLTTSKGNTVAAINELFTSASNGKTQVAAAITGKGVPASGSDTFPVLAQKIGQIVKEIKVTTGNFNPAISNNQLTGSITDLPFTPKVLILSGYIRLYSIPGPISVNAYGQLIAYNDGTLVIGESIGATMSEPRYDFSSFNIGTVDFGENSLSFALRISSSGNNGLATIGVNKYIVFGV